MRKTFLALLIGFITIVSNAQTNTVTGIGKLKLGSNISIVKDLGYDIVTVTDYSQSLSKQTKICEMVADTNLVSQPTIYGKADPRAKVFRVPLIKISEGIEIKNAILTFLNDSLVGINCEYNTSLNEALDIKYGKSETKITEAPHKFTKTYTGEEITLTDVTYDNEWGDSNIMCHSTLKKYYSGSIEAKYLSYFSLNNKKALEDINAVSAEYKIRAQKRIDDSKKKSLSDF